MSIKSLESAKVVLTENGINLDEYKTLGDVATAIITKVIDPVKMALCLGLTNVIKRHFEPPKERSNQPKLGKLNSRIVNILKKHGLSFAEFKTRVDALTPEDIKKIEFVAAKPKRTRK